VLRWRGSEDTTKERRVLQPSSGEDAGIRALLSRVGARRAEGGHRFARVYSCRSALPTCLLSTNTDLREARVLCGCIRAVGCYAVQTICMEDPTALVIGRGEQRICTSSPTARAHAGRSGLRETREEATAVVPVVVTMMCYAATNTCRAVMAFDRTALLVIAGGCTVYRARGRKQDQGRHPASARSTACTARESPRGPDPGSSDLL